MFALMYYMGFSYQEVYNLPLWQREWFIKRTQREIKKSDGQSRAAEANTPDIRNLQGRTRDQVPSKLRRFS